MAQVTDTTREEVREIVYDFFSEDCEIDINARSLKAQLKFADKKNALYNVVLGENEIDTNKAIIKNMSTQEIKEVSIDSITKRIIENKI